MGPIVRSFLVHDEKFPLKINPILWERAVFNTRASTTGQRQIKIKRLFFELSKLQFFRVSLQISLVYFHKSLKHARTATIIASIFNYGAPTAYKTVQTKPGI